MGIVYFNDSGWYIDIMGFLVRGMDTLSRLLL